MVVLRVALSVLAGLAVARAQTTTASTTTASAATESASVTSSSISDSGSSSSSIISSSSSDVVSSTTTESAPVTSSSISDSGSSATSSSISDSGSSTSSSSTEVTTTSSTSSSTSSTSTTSSSSTPSATTTTTTALSLESSVDASSYLAYAFPTSTPTWATGAYYTQLATALYAVDRSFVQRTDYQAITSAIYSAGDAAGAEVSASLNSSAFGWAVVTTNSWYQTAVPTAYQTEVVEYNSAWVGAENSVKQAAATAGTSAGNAVVPRCGVMAMVGVAAGAVLAVVL